MNERQPDRILILERSGMPCSLVHMHANRVSIRQYCQMVARGKCDELQMRLIICTIITLGSL